MLLSCGVRKLQIIVDFLKPSDNVVDLSALNTNEAHMFLLPCQSLKFTVNQEQHKSPSPPSSMKCMSKNDSSSIEGEKGQDGTRISFKNPPYTRCIYEIGPPPWIQKEMTTRSIQKYLVRIIIPY